MHNLGITSPGSSNTPQSVTVKLILAACGLTLNLAGTTSGASGGSGSVGIVGPAACSGAVKSNAAWIMVNSGASVAGGGSVSYTVAANPGAQRT